MNPLGLIALLALVAGAAASNSSWELHIYGTAPTAQHHSAWTYDVAGDDWVGVDSATGAPWACLSGQQQSPVNVPGSLPATSAPIEASQRAAWQLGSLTSNGTGSLGIANTGHSIQVFWADAGFAPSVSVSIQEGGGLLSSLDLVSGARSARVQAAARQLHFHTPSEHLIAGRLLPLEAHLVSVVPQSSLAACPPAGCVVVTAVLFELADEAPGSSDPSVAWLARITERMPSNEGEVAQLPPGSVLDLSQLLPGNESYLAYAGSLTTPPCSEGVLWLVLQQPQRLSMAQWRGFQKAVGDLNCTLLDASAPAAGSSNASSSSSNTSSGSGGSGRRLQQADAGAAEQQQRWSCSKLGAGANARLPQPLNGRAFRAWRDSAMDSGGKRHGWDDPAQAASAGAIAGIVLGTTLGAGLTVLIGWLGWKEYNRRRLKRFYKFAAGTAQNFAVERELESQQWLQATPR